MTESAATIFDTILSWHFKFAKQLRFQSKSVFVLLIQESVHIFSLRNPKKTDPDTFLCKLVLVAAISANGRTFGHFQKSSNLGQILFFWDQIDLLEIQRRETRLLTRFWSKLIPNERTPKMTDATKIAFSVITNREKLLMFSIFLDNEMPVGMACAKSVNSVGGI